MKNGFISTMLTQLKNLVEWKDRVHERFINLFEDTLMIV